MPATSSTCYADTETATWSSPHSRARSRAHGTKVQTHSADSAQSRQRRNLSSSSRMRRLAIPGRRRPSLRMRGRFAANKPLVQQVIHFLRQVILRHPLRRHCVKSRDTLASPRVDSLVASRPLLQALGAPRFAHCRLRGALLQRSSTSRFADRSARGFPYRDVRDVRNAGHSCCGCGRSGVCGCFLGESYASAAHVLQVFVAADDVGKVGLPDLFRLSRRRG
jgi:hypothetical protein